MRYLEMARALSGDLDVTLAIPSETLEVPMFVWCAIGKNVGAQCWWKTVTWLSFPATWSKNFPFYSIRKHGS